MSHNTESIFKVARFAKYGNDAGLIHVQDAAAKADVERHHAKWAADRATVAAAKVWVGKWNESDKARQLALKTVPLVSGRDQSEDRAYPKFIVAGYGLSGKYRVMEAATGRDVGTFFSSADATAYAIRMEAIAAAAAAIV